MILFYPNYSGSKIVYSYNGNGTISFQSYTGNFTNQNTLVETGTTYINSEGNISKVEIYRGVDLYTKIEYTYDNRNHIFKNIIGYGKLNSNFEGNKNNLMSKRVYDGNGTLVSGFDSVYTYNSDNFPSSLTPLIIGSSSTSTTEYFY